MEAKDIRHAWAILDRAVCIHTPEEVETALDRLAQRITVALADRFPVALCIMGGAVVFAGQLLPRLRFPLEFDYLHATRYRGSTRGAAIHWEVLPRKDLAGRTVLLMDDILDEGHTLAAAREKLLELGAAEVLIAVLADKDLGRAKPIKAHFVGLTLPDRYVFGMGMDAYGLWRNLPGIYALGPEDGG